MTDPKPPTHRMIVDGFIRALKARLGERAAISAAAEDLGLTVRDVLLHIDAIRTSPSAVAAMALFEQEGARRAAGIIQECLEEPYGREVLELLLEHAPTAIKAIQSNT